MRQFKAVVTIFQCKRAILPHFFIKNIYPQMKKIFPGEMEVYLIQHIPKEGYNITRTSQFGNDGLQTVKEWTEKGMYAGSTIIQHSDFCEKHPILPTYKRGVEIFLNKEADFHLWLEDDALVFDRSCDKWPEFLRNKDAGIYRANKNGMINCCYLVGTPNYEKKLQEVMQDESKWDLSKSIYTGNVKNGVKELNLESPRMETTLTRLCTSKAVLSDLYAERTHQTKPQSFSKLMKFMFKINSLETQKFLPMLKEQWEKEKI